MPLRRRRFGGGWAGAAAAALPDRVIRAPGGGVGAGAGAGARRPSAMGLRARFAKLARRMLPPWLVSAGSDA